MEKRRLGNSDIDITLTGFGAWAIGGSGWDYAWGGQDDNESIAAIHKTLDMGVNWIDTAAVYGLGHSETVVAKALKSYSGSKPYVFTKCGLAWDDKGNTFRRLDADAIRRECENSLKRLETDVIDLYQIHWPPVDNDNLIDAAWEMLARLKEEGKVRYIGVSNFNAAQIKRAQKIAPVTSLQPPYSLVNRSNEPEILPYCMENNIGVIVYSPMQSGLLTGKYDRKRIEELPEDDWRRRSSEFKEPKLTQNLKIIDKLKQTADKLGRTPGEIAIAWTLHNPAVTAAIVGARNARQAEGVMNAGNIKLSDEEYNYLSGNRGL